LSEYIGDIEVPEIVADGTFALVSDYPHGYGHGPGGYRPSVRIGNAKIEQRILARQRSDAFLCSQAALNETDREALRDFWENHYGPYGSFTYNAPNDNGVGTTAYTVRFANEPLSWEFLSDAISSWASP